MNAQLHYLLKFCIDDKILRLTYKSLHPWNLTDLLQPYAPPCALSLQTLACCPACPRLAGNFWRQSLQCCSKENSVYPPSIRPTLFTAQESLFLLRWSTQNMFFRVRKMSSFSLIYLFMLLHPWLAFVLLLFLFNCPHVSSFAFHFLPLFYPPFSHLTCVVLVNHPMRI